MKHLMSYLGVSLVLCAVLMSGCKKEEDPIDAFIRSHSGVYVEAECGNGGVTQGRFTLENATLRITKKTENSADLICSHSALGNLFSVEGVYENDTLLNILPVTIEGRNFTGQFRHFKNGSGGRRLSLFDDEIQCREFGDPVSNVSFNTN